MKDNSIVAKALTKILNKIIKDGMAEDMMADIKDELGDIIFINDKSDLLVNTEYINSLSSDYLENKFNNIILLIFQHNNNLTLKLLEEFIIVCTNFTGTDLHKIVGENIIKEKDGEWTYNLKEILSMPNLELQELINKINKANYTNFLLNNNKSIN